MKSSAPALKQNVKDMESAANVFHTTEKQRASLSVLNKMYNKYQFDKNYYLAVNGIVEALNLIRKGNKSASYRIETIFNLFEISKQALKKEIKQDFILREKFKRIDEYREELGRLVQ